MYKFKIILLYTILTLFMISCGKEEKEEIEYEEEIITMNETTLEVDYKDIKIASNGALVSIHDPSIKVFDDKYFLYGSHMTGAYSEDLQTWTYIGNTYSSSNKLFSNLFDNSLDIFDYSGDYGNGSYAVWAEDVIYNKSMEKYIMYFCTSSTYIKSALCYAISDYPEGPYTYQGTLLYSGFTKEEIEKTNVLDVVDEDYVNNTYLKMNGEYNNDDWPNCIDPAPFYDENDKLWMVYGSWSGGIFLLELDPETGLIIHPEEDKENKVDSYFGKRLMGGGHKSIEGPYIQYDKETGYYYLYVSYGSLERTGGYQMRVFRSEKPDGEYVDMNGSYPTKGYNHFTYGLKLTGNYYIPSAKYAFMATGGQSTFIDNDGKRYVCYHTRFDNGTEYHEPAVKQIFMNKEGWPVFAPFTTKGESISLNGYDSNEVIGSYYFMNHGRDISSKIVEPIMIELMEDGSINGLENGTWNIEDNSAFMTVTYEDKEFSGVFCKMFDEANTKVMTFTAVGNNESIYGIKY